MRYNAFGYDYLIRFNYAWTSAVRVSEVPQALVVQKSKLQVATPNLVTCEILVGSQNAKEENMRILASGMALRDSNDPFVKETSRKIALTRALQKCGFLKATRKVAWEHYLNRKGSVTK